VLPGAEVLACVHIDSQQKRVYGHAKQGTAFGFTKIGHGPAGPRAECASHVGVYATSRLRDRWHEPARRQRIFRP
jgi:hypothetical protein